MLTPKPYKERRIKKNVMLREFSENSKSDDFIWHQDKKNRQVYVIKSDGWKLQMQTGLPFHLEEGMSYNIPAFTWHRVIQGKGSLMIKIVEENLSDKLKSLNIKMKKILNESNKIPWLHGVELSLNTSNKDKLAEYQRLGLVGLKTTRIDLPEPNGTPDEVIASKATQAGEGVIVEDTSLDIEGADVGVNIRWMMDNLKHLTGRKAIFRTMLGVLIEDQVHIFTGEIHGTIVKPRGNGFGFDNYFLPNHGDMTLGEEKPDRFNPRAIALKKFIEGDGYTLPALHWEGEWQH
jgi:XTP/dITP diphosphohydrolase